MGVFVKTADGWLNLETGAAPAVDPTKAAITSDPVKVSAQTDPVSYTVALNDGSSKKLWVLQGNTGSVTALRLTEEAFEKVPESLAAKVRSIKVPADFDGDPATLLPRQDRADLDGMVEVAAVPQDQAVYTVGLTPGVLYGVCLGSGGTGGSSRNTGAYGGGGGAGGVIGFGANIQVPIFEAGTYTFTVGSTTPTGESKGNAAVDVLNGQPTFITDANGIIIASAMGGGHGACWDNVFQPPGQGGSGGGTNTSGPAYDIYLNGRPVPGQGNPGAGATSNGGAGGGYSEAGKEGGYPGEATAGGDGFDIVTAFDLDTSDTQVQDFITAYTGYGGDGFIAGGGGGYGGNEYLKNPGGKGGGGNGYYTGGGADTHMGRDFTGGGGGGTFNTQGVAGGGAGAVYLLGDV